MSDGAGSLADRIWQSRPAGRRPGPAAAEAVGSWQLPGVTVDALPAHRRGRGRRGRARCRPFRGRLRSGTEPFPFQPVGPAGAAGFSTHSVEPDAVLALARELFGAGAAGYVLGIRGYDFDEFGESLSDRAARKSRGGAGVPGATVAQRGKEPFHDQTAGSVRLSVR